MERRHGKPYQYTTGPTLKVPPPKPKFVEWRQQPESWRLRGAMLRLSEATRESTELLRVIREERIDGESRALNRMRETLIADAARVRHDLEAMSRLSTRIAAFYQRVGALEQTVEALMCEREPGRRPSDPR